VLHARSDGTEDLQALVRELDTRLFGGQLELLKPQLEYWIFHSHFCFLSKNYS
jgi:hypothetical protein